MADMELILRFFAMSELQNREEKKLKQINLTKYLNNYMGDKTNVEEDIIDKMGKEFVEMIETCKKVFGKSAFRNLKKDSTEFTNKINPAIFDAVAVATSYAIKKDVVEFENNYLAKYKELLDNEDFKDASSHRTTNTENIFKRIELASKLIYGIKYER